MLKYLFPIILLAVNHAEAQENPAPAARICLASVTLDVGEIEWGSAGIFIFDFESCGTGPLIIRSCNTSCGCMVCSWPIEPFPPGQKGKLKIKYDTRRIGPVNKSVTVRTNDPGEEALVLRIKGKVRQPAAAMLSDSSLCFRMPATSEIRYFELHNRGLGYYHGEEADLEIVRIEQVKGSPCALVPVSLKLKRDESTHLEFIASRDKDGKCDKAWEVTFNDNRPPMLLTASGE